MSAGCIYVSILWENIFSLDKNTTPVSLISIFHRNQSVHHLPFRSSRQRCSIKKLFLKFSQNPQENNCARVSFLIKLQAEACKKDSVTGVFRHLADWDCLLFGWRLYTWLNKGCHFRISLFLLSFFQCLFLFLFFYIYRYVEFIQTLPSYFKMNIKTNACKKLLYRFLEIWTCAIGCIT